MDKNINKAVSQLKPHERKKFYDLIDYLNKNKIPYEIYVAYEVFTLFIDEKNRRRILVEYYTELEEAINVKEHIEKIYKGSVRIRHVIIVVYYIRNKRAHDVFPIKEIK